MLCVSCGVVLAPGARFCSACGQKQPESAAAAPIVTSAERRQLTALYCEIQGSVRGLSPNLQDDFLRRMGDVLLRYGGKVIQVRPRSTLAYFGFPTAHEDDADRAVRAALDIREVVLQEVNVASGHNEPDSGLRIKLAVHTGMAVVGGERDAQGAENYSLGDAAGVASRLPGLDLPYGILVSGATAALLKQVCTWEGETEVDLRGVDEPLILHGLLHAKHTSGSGGRHAVSVPLQGRDTEQVQLREAWASTANPGQGAAVLLVAEPGMGKSLSVVHFLRDVVSNGGVVHRMDCSAYQAHSPWHPVVAWLKEQCQWRTTDDVAAKSQKLKDLFFSEAGNTSVSALALALGLPVAPDDPVMGLAPTVVRALAEQAVCRWLVQSHGENAAVVVFEDVHWADPTTLEFIRQLMAHRLCVVLTARPEFNVPPNYPQGFVQRLELRELASSDGLRVAMEATGGKPLPAEILNDILRATDGNPFFIVEYTRAVIDSGRLIELPDRYEVVGAVPAGLIPGSLRDTLTARLDRTGPARSVARYASVIGRTFNLALLDAVYPEGPQSVASAMGVLLRAGLVREVDGAAEPTYEFQHALVQVTAYESMLRREREGIHANVAESLDKTFPATAAQQPELVARHLTESRQWVPAIQRWLQAAMRGIGQCAYAETLAQVAEAEALLQHIPPTQSQALELALLSVKGPALIATTGFGSDQVGVVYARTQALCAGMDDRPETFPSLWGNWVYNLVRGRLDVSLAYSQRMWTMGVALNASAMQVEGAWTSGNASFWSGQLRPAEQWLDKAVALYDREAHASHAGLFGQDPGVAAHCYLSMVLTYRGNIAEGRAHLAAADQLAQQINHPFSTAWVRAFDHMYGLACDKNHALVASRKTLDYCYEQSTPFWIAAGHVVHGWAVFHLEDRAAGLEELRMGIAIYQSTGSLLVQGVWQALLADCLANMGLIDEAMDALNEGMRCAQSTGEHLASALLGMAKGVLTAATGDRDGALTQLSQALDVADACAAHWVSMQISSALVSLNPGNEAHRARLAASFNTVQGAEGLPAWENARTLLAL
jgi:class 3 adenylate cyclase/tetratricopeptide (TPR) repeat protein